MYDLVFFILAIVSITVLVFTNIVSKKKATRLASELLASNLDNLILKDSVRKLVDQQSQESLEKTDGFINFVSQSRDWAFKYIEDVQEALEEFDYQVAKSFKYANTYGNLVDGPLLGVIHDIESAYLDLKRVLPDNNADL